jgi:hypothetical protein
MRRTENGREDTKCIGREKTRKETHTKAGTDYSQGSENSILKKDQNNNQKPKNAEGLQPAP